MLYGVGMMPVISLCLARLGVEDRRGFMPFGGYGERFPRLKMRRAIQFVRSLLGVLPENQQRAKGQASQKKFRVPLRALRGWGGQAAKHDASQAVPAVREWS
jgi:hypothetical protein